MLALNLKSYSWVEMTTYCFPQTRYVLYYPSPREPKPGLSPAESTKSLVVRPPWTAIIIIMYRRREAQTAI